MKSYNDLTSVIHHVLSSTWHGEDVFLSNNREQKQKQTLSINADLTRTQRTTEALLASGSSCPI